MHLRFSPVNLSRKNVQTYTVNCQLGLTCILLKDAEHTEMTLEGHYALDSGFKIQEEQAKNMLKQTCL